MKLHELLSYNQIVVQCHDNPDADAIASGYAVYLYLLKNSKAVRLVYGGYNLIRKSNLVLMVKELDIPIEHVESLDNPELLVTVDGQYGESNMTRFEAQNIAVIDHHRISGKLPVLSEVRSNLGACATLVWQLLKDENFDMREQGRMVTALYYGLYMDTNGFSEISHPLDRDLRDGADFDKILITRLRNANLSLEELETAGAALLHCDYDEEHRFAIVKAGQCDPNILGIISDLILEVDAVDSCLVFNILPNRVKLSVRSCIKEVKANELAKEICAGIGDGGGHIVKSGGNIKMELLIPAYEKYCQEYHLTPRMELQEDGKKERPTDSAIKSFLNKRVEDYFKNSEIIYARTYEPNWTEMKAYRKKPLPVGYIRATDLCREGGSITLRSIDGDVEIQAQPDTIIMVGMEGEAYISREAGFQQNYTCYEEKFVLNSAEYRPTLRINAEDTVISLLDYAKVCVPTGEAVIRARRLDHNVKIFPVWDESAYKLGIVGDYLAVNSEDAHDVYTIKRQVFEQLYEPVEMEYTFRRALPADAAPMAALMEEVYNGLINKDIYVCDDLAYMQEQLEHGAVGVVAETGRGEMAGCFLATFPGEQEKNLGHELGLTGRQLRQVVHMDTAAVLPGHRGHHLEKRMLTYLEGLLGGEYNYLMATVSPDNPASYKTLEENGYQLLSTKEKYDGLMRRIYWKKV